MNGDSILLDTNVVIHHFRTPTRYDSRLFTKDFYLPSIVLGELCAGANKSARPDHHLKKINEFAAQGTLLDTDFETCQIYGKIWANLTARGQLIPTNDIWIAALSLRHQLQLITHD
ncbi:MAG: PIN domain-containing protein [Verrucomicrobiota bacterium]